MCAKPNEKLLKKLIVMATKNISLLVECSRSVPKQSTESFHCFCRADFELIEEPTFNRPSEPNCHTNKNKISEELYQYFEHLFKAGVPTKTYHRKGLLLWITFSTSNLMKRR